MRALTAVGLMLFAAKSIAMDSGGLSTVSPENLRLVYVPEEKVAVAPPGWCSNLPISYEHARIAGIKCN